MITELEGLQSSDGAPSGAFEALGLLRKQATLFSRLEELGQRQRAMVVREDSRPMLRLLAERQGLSLELALLSRNLQPARANWTSLQESLPASERDEADALLGAVQQSLLRIMESDELHARVLEVPKPMARSRRSAPKGRSAVAGRCRGRSAHAGRRVDEAS